MRNRRRKVSIFSLGQSERLAKVVTERKGRTFRVWVNAQTFLEVKIEGPPRRLDGTDHPLEVYCRDYRTVDGLQVPFVMETRVLPLAKNALGFRDTPVPTEKIIIERWW